MAQESVRIILVRIDEKIKAMDEKLDIKISEVKDDTLYLRGNNTRQWQAIDENTKKTAQIKPIWWVIGFLWAAMAIAGAVASILK